MSEEGFRNFGYLVSLLSIIYSSGQAGFCTCFFGVEFDEQFIFYDIWCLIESVITFFAALLLGFGIFKENKKLILAWYLIVLFSLLVYFGVAIYVVIVVIAIMHHEFLVPTLCWKLFLIVALVVIKKHYLPMDK